MFTDWLALGKRAVIALERIAAAVERAESRDAEESALVAKPGSFAVDFHEEVPMTRVHFVNDPECICGRCRPDLAQPLEVSSAREA